MAWYPWCEQAIRDICVWFETKFHFENDNCNERMCYILNTLVSELPESEQEIIWLRCGEGKSYREISKKLNIEYEKVIDIYYDNLSEACDRFGGLKPRKLYNYTTYYFDKTNSVLCVEVNYKVVHKPIGQIGIGTPNEVSLEKRNDELGKKILLNNNLKRAKAIWEELERIDTKLKTLDYKS